MPELLIRGNLILKIQTRQIFWKDEGEYVGAGFSHDSVQPLFVWRLSLLKHSRAEQAQSDASVAQSPGELLQSCSLPSPGTGIWLFLVSLFYFPVPNAVKSWWFPQGGFPGVFS